MTTQTALATQAAPLTAPASGYRLSFARVLRSEWIKLATVRSTWWSVAITAALTIGIAVLIALAVGEVPGFTGITAVIMPIQFTMLLAGILGVISVTGEYSTGMIRSTLTAVPARGVVLAAKAVVMALVLFFTSLAIFLAAAVVVSPIFADTAGAIDWASFDGTYLPILVASASMAAFALIGVALGFVLRSGAGAIAAVVGLLFVLPIVAQMFAMAGEAWKWVLDAGNYLPMAAAQFAILPSEQAPVDANTAYLTLAAWVVGGLLAAWAVLRTRDA